MTRYGSHVDISGLQSGIQAVKGVSTWRRLFGVGEGEMHTRILAKDSVVQLFFYQFRNYKKAKFLELNFAFPHLIIG